MSYDLYLQDAVMKKTIELNEPHFIRGGTYAMNGTTELWLNITYNYGKIFRRPDVLGENGIETLIGMTALESIPVLEKAILALGNDTDVDYWKATEGNAKRALIQLLTFARMRPDGIWDGDL